MRTPAGTECKHFYEDYNRGRNIRECRLVKANPDSLPWRPFDCQKCPVPAILQANASPDLELTLTIRTRLLGFVRTAEVSAWCIKHRAHVDNPHIGCEQCNAERPGLDIFRKALEPNDDD